MQFQFLHILMVGLIFSTALTAVEPKKVTPEKMSQGTFHKISPKEHLDLLKKVHNFNQVFDDYHTGSIPYDNK